MTLHDKIEQVTHRCIVEQIVSIHLRNLVVHSGHDQIDMTPNETATLIRCLVHQLQHPSPMLHEDTWRGVCADMIRLGHDLEAVRLLADSLDGISLVVNPRPT